MTNVEVNYVNLIDQSKGEEKIRLMEKMIEN